VKEYNKGMLKAIAILIETLNDAFDDEAISDAKFKIITAYNHILMTEFNKALMNDNNIAESKIEQHNESNKNQTVTSIKQSQRKIEITGTEWYDNGVWKMIITNPLGYLEFLYTINDTDGRDLTFEEFIKEALEKYNTRQ